MIQLLERARNFKDRTALVSNGKSFTYADLLEASKRVAAHLLGSRSDLDEARIAFLVPPSFEYTAIQWGIWSAGGIAVPLCVLHPLPSIQYVLEDTQADLVIAHEDFIDFLKPLETPSRDFQGVRIIALESIFKEKTLVQPDIQMSRRAMILYTSGTTSKPKGVVTTHDTIEAQITTLVNAWEWEKEDHILNILPLHHVHGIINVMSCALWTGACCEFLPKFDAKEVWECIKSGR